MFMLERYPAVPRPVTVDAKEVFKKGVDTRSDKFKLER